jgi:dienelactone hydrolase
MIFKITYMKAVLITITVLFVVLVIIFEDVDYQQHALSFMHNGNRLSGTIIVPKSQAGPFPVMVFVHGDGVMPYDAYGYYHTLWNRLAQQGIASFAWDKPGVGKSQGDWLNQSMDDRAKETIAAMEVLKRHSDINPDKIGLIGYSQAGWVLPLVAEKSDDADFIIVVSGAINWMDQGGYLTKMRMTR